VGISHQNPFVKEVLAGRFTKDEKAKGQKADTLKWIRGEKDAKEKRDEVGTTSTSSLINYQRNG
jgi:hypothetical protein